MNITPSLCAQITQIGRAYPDMKKISLFGSRARGDNHERSDIDLAVYFHGKPNPYALSDLDDLNTLLMIDMTVMRDTLNEKFRKRIQDEEVVIYNGDIAGQD